MGITIEELKKLDKNTYQIIDIRDENEVAHGAIPGAVATPADSIEGNENIDFSKKLVICCSRGRFSVEVAEGLEEKGMDAVSLEGGYIAWLLDAMKQEEEVDICKDVELSIRKKFRKSIWCKFTKAINQYELVKPGDRIAVCISGGKDSMLMAKLFQELKIHNKFDFEVKFLVMDPGYSPANRKVIEEKKFSWVHYTSITSSNAYERDLLFASELLFRLNVLDMDDIIGPYFKEQTDKTKKLSPSEEMWDDIYEVSTKAYGQDWRHTYHWTYSGSDPYLSKFWQYENGTYKNFMPVLRWSEMYYIAAEASLNTDSRQAVRYLNTVRNNRYLDFDPLDENLPVTQIQNEIYKEYRKELVGEGQLFYYYKRLNFASIPGSAVSGSDDIYVLPMPENEVEFGNRQ